MRIADSKTPIINPIKVKPEGFLEIDTLARSPFLGAGVGNDGGELHLLGYPIGATEPAHYYHHRFSVATVSHIPGAGIFPVNRVIGVCMVNCYRTREIIVVCVGYVVKVGVAKGEGATKA